MVIPLCYILITNLKTKNSFQMSSQGLLHIVLQWRSLIFVSGWWLCIVPVAVFLFSFLSLIHSCLPNFLLPFYLTVPIYYFLWLDLLVNPVAFAILVAASAFPYFLPSGRLRDDEHDVRSSDWLGRRLQGLQLVIDAFQLLNALCVKGGHTLFVRGGGDRRQS